MVQQFLKTFFSTPLPSHQERTNPMSNISVIMGIFVFLVSTSLPAFAETSERKQGLPSNESQSGDTSQGMGSSIESQNPSNKTDDPELQKGARPGGVGEEGETSIFGSPSTLPPGEHAPQFEGADKEQQERERRQ
jgi:hypothetical protein